MARQRRLAGDERLGAAVGPALRWIIPPSSIDNTTDKIILSWLKHVLDWRWLSAAFSLIAWPPLRARSIRTQARGEARHRRRFASPPNFSPRTALPRN
jgi:hypothetical protein